MVSRSLSVLVALIPAVAFANAVADENPEIPQAELETWSDEQLCRARDIPEALDELERREVFDRRDLRAIRRDEVRKGISEDALRCLKGAPETIRPAVGMTADGDPMDAFVYPIGTSGSLVVFVKRQGDASTVTTLAENSEQYLPASGASGRTSLVGSICSARLTLCVPMTGANSQHRSAVSRANGMVASPPSLPSQ